MSNDPTYGSESLLLKTNLRPSLLLLPMTKKNQRVERSWLDVKRKPLGSLLPKSELEIMTSDVKDLKKSLAERESELLGLKDEILTSRSIGQSSFNLLSIFFQGFQTCQVSVEALEPEKLPIASYLTFRSQLLRRFRVMSSDITKMMFGIEESHHGPSDALHNLPSHLNSLKRFLFHLSRRLTCYLLTSHSENVDIENVAVNSSLRSLKPKRTNRV
ncbi:hypothetical protein Tco_1434495 [Tanacetum coccineum]